MSATVLGAWVLAQNVGVAVAVGAWAWLRFPQSTARAASALDPGLQRADVLSETLAASDAGWARLVGAALCEGDPDVQRSYRDAATPAADDATLTALLATEQGRLRRGVAVGLAGCAAMLASGVAIGSTRDLAWLGALDAVAAGAIAWRIVVAARGVAETMREVVEALPALRLRVGTSAPCPAFGAPWSRLPLSDAIPLLVAPLALPVVALGAMLLAVGVVPLDALRAVRLCAMCAMFAAASAMAVAVGTRRELRVEPRHHALVVVRSFAGVPLATLRVPLELLRGFEARMMGVGRSRRVHLVALLGAVPMEIQLGSGPRATPGAAMLNEAFGFAARGADDAV